MSESKSVKEGTQWHKLRRLVNKTDYQYSDDWNKAIQIFERRLENKYIEPILDLLAKDKKRGQGFPILTISCTLIETLAAFKYGKIYNPRYNEGVDPNFQYKDSMHFFCRFLREVQPFSNYFDTNEFTALDFYSNVRSALVHECRTRNYWIIRTTKGGSAKILFEKEKNNKIIFRTTLFKAIADSYLPEYFEELRERENFNHRRFFARKLDHLFEIGRNQKEFHWWREEV